MPHHVKNSNLFKVDGYRLPGRHVSTCLIVCECVNVYYIFNTLQSILSLCEHMLLSCVSCQLGLHV